MPCSAVTSNVNITVNQTPTANAGLDQTINFGTSTTLTGVGGVGTPGYTYLWTPAGSIAGANNVATVTTQNLTTNPTIFTVLVTDSKGCIASDQVQITLTGSALAVGVTALPGEICNNGATVQLTATASGGNSADSISYIWSSFPAGFTSTLQNPTVTPSVTTVYTVTVNDGFNTASNSVTVTVNSLPVIYNVTGGGEYCAGGIGKPMGLSNSQIGVDYQLLLGGVPLGSPLTGTGAAITFGNQTLTGTYTVHATVTLTSCNVNMTGNVAIIINPLPIVNAGLDQTIPYGTPTTLIGSVSSGTPNYLYIWTPAGSINGANTNATVITQNLTTDPTTFTFTVTDTKGCSAFDQMLVHLNGSALAVGISAIPQVICNNGASVQLSATASGGNSADSISYSWISFPVGFTSTLQNPIVTPSVNTIYTVTVNDEYNTVSNTVSVTVNPLPIVYNVTGGGEYCIGGTGKPVGLSNSQLGVEYQLRLGGVAVGAPVTGTGAAITFGNQTTAGTYTVHATVILTGCNIDMNGIVLISINPLPVANAGLDQLINFGTSTTLVGSASAGTSPFNYVWTPAGSINGLNTLATVTTQNLTTNPTNFTLTVTDSKGCTNNDLMAVNLNGSALAVAVAASPQVICNNGATIQLNATATGGNSADSLSFSWTSSPGGFTSTLMNPIVAPTTTTIYTVTVHDGYNTASVSITVTVNLLPTSYNLTGGGEYCASGIGMPVGLNGSEPGISYQLYYGILTDGAPVIGTGAPISFGTKTASGTYTVRATNTITGCWQMMSGNATITINPLPTVDAGIAQVISYGISTSLSGFATGGTGALTYTWTPAVNIAMYGNTLSPTTTNLYSSTTFTLLVSDTKSCSSSDQVQIDLSGSALSISVVVTPDTICFGDFSQLTATGSGGSGTYTFSWVSSPVGSPPWSSTLSNPIVSPPVTTSYTVTINDGYNTAFAIVNLVVNPIPVQYPVTGGGMYCSGGPGVPVGVQNSQNGVVYKLYRGFTQVGLPVNGNGGAITFGNQTVAGNYFVKGTKTATGCFNMMADSAIVSILPLPTSYTVTGGGSYPAGGSGVPVGLANSQVGVEYELSNGSPILPRVLGTGSPISFGLQTVAGTYTVTAYTLTNPVCTAAMTGSVSVIINPWPTIFNVYGGGGVCADDSTGKAVGIDGSEIGVTYQLKRDGLNLGGPIVGTGDSISFGYYHVGTNYSVTATNDLTGLVRLMNGIATITVNPLPVAYVMGSYGDNCVGSEIMLNGSQTGVNYVLRLNISPTDTMPGTGAVLNFGPQYLAGDYTIYAYFTSTGCDTIMDGVIHLNPSPNVYNVRPPGVSCAGDTVSITGSQLGIIYQLQRNSFTNVGSPLPGTGMPISFGPQTVPGVYSVLAINPLTNCKIFMNGTANLNPLPSLFTIVPNGDTCAGVSIGLSGSQLGMKYILKRDTLWMDTINGTGSPIEFGIQTIPGIYTIIGYDTTTFKFCSNLMLGSTNLHPGPVLHPIIPSGFNCVGDSIGLANSDIGVSYQLIIDGITNAGPPITGTGGAIWFGIQNYPGTYTIIGRNTTTTCSSVMTGTCILTPLPLAYTVIPQGDTCAGTSIGLNLSQIGVNYILMRDNVPVITLPGTGGILSFGPQTISGTYVIRAYNVTPDSCYQLMTGATVIHQGPLAFNVIPTGLSCAGSIVGLTGSEAGVQYQLFRDGIFNIGPPVPGTGLAISFGIQVQPGVYTIVATTPGTSCSSSMTGSATLLTLPTVYLMTPTGDTCAHSNIGINSSQAGIHYTLFRDGIYPVATINGTGGPISFGLQTTSGVYTIVAYNSASDSCHTSMQGSLTLHPNPAIYSIIPSGTICGGSSIGLSFSEIGVNYQLFRDNIVIDTLPGNGGALDFGAQIFPGVYTILAINGTTNCWAVMNGSTTLHLSPTPFAMIPTGDACEQVQIGLNGSQTGINYILKRDGIPVQTIPGTGSPVLFTYITTSGTYSIIADNTTSDTCSSIMNGTLIIHPLPLAFNVTPQGANCEPTILGISGSQSGVNYELIKNGLATGIILPGTGSALSFGAQLAGVYSVTGKYPLSPNCHDSMAGTVIVNSPPTVEAGPNDSVCHSAMTYTLSAIGSYYSSLSWSSSGDGFFTNGTTLTAIYHIGILDKVNGLVNLSLSAVGKLECPGTTATDMMTLIIDPLPIANAGTDIDLCQGQIVQLNGTTQFSNTVVWTTMGDGLFSNNSILNPTYTPGTNDLLNGIFNLVLTTHGSLTCQAEIDRDTITVFVYPLPTATISATGSICESDTASIMVHLTGNPPWSITFTDGVSTITVPNIGSSPFILQVNPVVTTSYSLTAISDVHCDGTSFTGTATIGVFAKPIAYTVIVSNGGGYCEGGSGVTIGLSNSQTGIKYELLLGGIQTANSIIGTGLPFSFGLFTLPGLYTVMGIDTTTAARCSRLMNGTATVIIHPSPVVDFHADTTCVGQPTQFILLGPDIGKIALWSWNFGDGNTANYNYLYLPTHTYPTYGDYQVVLLVTDTNGCQRQVIHNIHVMQLPISLFGISTPTCQGLNVSFTDYSYSLPAIVTYLQEWIWIFGDGTTDTIHYPASPDVTHSYPLAGNYQVTLKVVTNFGCINQHTLPLTITPNPVANFAYSSNSCADKAVQFTDYSQLNGGGAVVGWQWNFGDPTSGTNNSSPLQNPVHIYAASGTYFVTMIISSTSGCPDTIAKSITVQMKPKALFSANSPCQGNITNFSDLSVANASSMLSWDWNFGDGFPHSNLQNPTHLYVLSGQYSVTLSITNSNHCAHDTTIIVNVIPLPLASYQTDSPKCLELPVYYSNLSTSQVGQIVKWHWTFGDGTDTTILFPGVPNVSHIFIGNSLQHTVRLMVTTNDSCSDYFETIIQSVIPPVANFIYSPTLCAGQITQFTDQTQLNGGGPLTSWYWDFNDPTSGTQNNSYLQNPVHIFTSAGTYTVVLTVNNAGTCIDSIHKSILINPQPVTDFSADTACFGTLTHFQDLTLPNPSIIVIWDWNFGDGTVHSYSANPGHLYAAPGTYSVTLTATNSNGCFQVRTRNVLVLPAPFASFIYSTNNCSGTAVQFTDQSSTPYGYIVQWKWNFGDGNFTTINLPAPTNVTHVYTNGGTYNVTLTVKTADSCTATVTHVINVDFAPDANFSSPAIHCAGMAVQFTDLSQPNGGGTIMNWAWNFGDPGTGTNNNSTLQNPFHVFSNGGTYQVQLIITNTSTCKDTVVKTVVIDNKPLANFAFDTVCKGDITHFTDASVGNTGTITNWLWSFGDGGISTAQNPTHQYVSSGSFQVSLTVTNSAGCSHDTTRMAIVNVKPSAGFSFTGTCKGGITQFSDMSSTSNGIINSWQWDFGDGGSASIQNPPHTYATTGIFNVTLIVSNSSGCSDTLTLPVSINPSPVAAYSYFNTYCPEGRVDFSDQSTATNTSIVSWYWTFEPGYNSGAQNPMYTYTQTNADYPVTLIVTDGHGCADTIVDTVHVKPAFQLAIQNNDTCLGNPNQFHAVNQASGDILHNFFWNFGEPASFTNTSGLKDPLHTYENPGSYFVTLKAWNSDNCMDSVYKMITVYPGSTADFSYNPGSFCTDTTVIFTNLSSGNNAPLDSLIYAFGDGTSAIRTAPFSSPDTVWHHYSAFGTYSVTLTAINTNGCKSIKTKQALVTCMITSFTMADTVICRNSLLTLTDNSTPQSLINKWYWEFGDGLDTTYFTHCNRINHNYLQPGSYNVKLVISTTISGITISDSSTREVLVKISPVANFSSINVCIGDSSKFIDLSDSNNVTILSHYWKFGDQLSGVNDTSTLLNPGHKYTHYGNFNPKLIVLNAVGCVDSVIKPIRVHKIPKAAFISEDLLCSRTYLDFTDQSKPGDTTALSYLWHLGVLNDPENISIEQNPKSYYDNAGDYDILLKIHDYFGCIDSIMHSISILPSPVSSFIPDQNYNGIAGNVLLTNTSTGAFAYYWTFDNGKNSREENPEVQTYKDNGTYTITLIASSDNKCTDTTTYTFDIYFRGLYVPNAFAPMTTHAGSMVFLPKGIGLKEYHLQIFDASGHKLFETQLLDPEGKPSEPWNGKDQSGNLMPQGTYVWTISATFDNDEVWKGSDNGKTKGIKSTSGTVTLIL